MSFIFLLAVMKSNEREEAFPFYATKVADFGKQLESPQQRPQTVCHACEYHRHFDFNNSNNNNNNDHDHRHHLIWDYHFDPTNTGACNLIFMSNSFIKWSTID